MLKETKTDMRLDCETMETTILSLSSIFNINANDLVKFLKSFDLEKLYEATSPDVPAYQFFFEHFEDNFNSPYQKVTEICWFHLTRIFPGNKFHQGILPLGKALELIWKNLFRIFENTVHHIRLQKLKNAGVKNYHYKLKTPDPFHWGPFAMLVRETAFKPKEMGNHDYLWLPEIVEDICNAYYETYNIKLYDSILKATSPCIVKFLERTDDGNWCLEPAVYYLYLVANNKKLTIDANTCFDGKGHIIPKENILKIEFLNSLDIEKPHYQ